MDTPRNKSDIPLIKAEHIQPFIEYVIGRGVDPKPLLEQACLPIKLLDAPIGYVPERRVWLFIDVCAKTLGMRDFGLRVGEAVDLARFGAFTENLKRCPTLFTVLGVFCELAKEESSDAEFWLNADHNQLWFYRGGVPGITFATYHVEMYVLMFMIKVVRLKLGENWMPEKILLKAKGCAEFLEHPLFKSVNVYCSSPNTGIGIPLVEASVAPGTRLGIANSSQCDENAFVGILVKALELYGNKESLSMESAAEIVGMSSRTIQRRLKDAGVSFKNLQDRLKLQESVKLMKVERNSLTEIALKLGYSDSAHFSRAFQRWTGVAPSKFRRNFILDVSEVPLMSSQA